MERPRDWREDLPSMQPMPEPRRYDAPRRHKRSILHTHGRDQFVQFLRAVEGLPNDFEIGLPEGSCVIPFGYHTDERQKPIREAQEMRSAHLERQAAFREHQRRLIQPWANGEWIE